MSPDSSWKRSTVFLIVIVAIGIVKTSAAQDLSAENFRRLGRQALDEGRYSDAERELRLAFEKFERDRNSFEIAQTLGDLASVFISEERYSEAEQLLDHALEMMPANVGAHPRETSRLLGNLGALYELTGKHRSAESAFNRALGLLEQYEPRDPHIVVLLGNRGALHAQNGSYKQAQADLRKALDLAERQLGNDHPDLAPLLTNLAALYERQKRWPLAESLLLRAARIVERTRRPDHPDSALIFEHLGVVHHRQKKHSQAEMELRRALEIERTELGTESSRSASTSLNLAKVLIEEHRYDEARILYGNTLRIQERIFGSKAPEVAATLEGFARLLHTMKTHAPADEMETRARRIRTELAYTVSLNDGQH